MAGSVAFTSEEHTPVTIRPSLPARKPRTVSQNVYLSCVEKESERVASLSTRPETVRAKYAASRRALVPGGLRRFV